MSLISQNIHRKGSYERSISNNLNLGGGANISQAIPFGAVDVSNDFASSSGGVITVNEAGKYRITVSMLSKGVIPTTINSFWQFRLDAGLTILAKIETQFVNPIGPSYGISDFGVHSFYDYETDATITGSPLVNVNGAYYTQWYGKLQISRTVTLNASDVVRFYFNGSNLWTGNKTIAFDGSISIEQIS